MALLASLSPIAENWREALRTQLAFDALRKEYFDGGAPELTFALYPHLWFFTLLGIGTLVLELSAPLALLHPWLGRGWAVATYLMHWGIYLIMDIEFRYYRTGIPLAPFFPIERAVSWLDTPRLRAWLGRAAAWAIDMLPTAH